MADVNLTSPFQAYTGKEPYIFVSYAHKNGASVYPDIARLHETGYRIWYDEGIDPGNEWPEEVATALAKSACFLVFISCDAIESNNVRNEINYAINHKKAFLAVHLEETKLLSGLELRMGDIQAVMKYRMDEERYFTQLFRGLPAACLSKALPDEKELTQLKDKIENDLLEAFDDKQLKLSALEYLIDKVPSHKQQLYSQLFLSIELLRPVRSPLRYGDSKSEIYCWRLLGALIRSESPQDGFDDLRNALKAVLSNKTNELDFSNLIWHWQRKQKLTIEQITEAIVTLGEEAVPLLIRDFLSIDELSGSGDESGHYLPHNIQFSLLDVFARFRNRLVIYLLMRCVRDSGGNDSNFLQKILSTLETLLSSRHNFEKAYKIALRRELQADETRWLEQRQAWKDKMDDESRVSQL